MLLLQQFPAGKRKYESLSFSEYLILSNNMTIRIRDNSVLKSPDIFPIPRSTKFSSTILREFSYITVSNDGYPET